MSEVKPTHLSKNADEQMPVCSPITASGSRCTGDQP